MMKTFPFIGNQQKRGIIGFILVKMGQRGKRLLVLLFLCNFSLQLLIGEASADSSFPRGPRGGQPEPIVQRRQSFDDSESHISQDKQTTSSWSFFSLGNSRNKRKLPNGSRESMPDFSCRDRPPGYYADIKLGCEVYHLCNRHGGGMAFECPGGTRFQQRTMVCDHKHLVDCNDSEQYFHSNLRIGQPDVNFIDDKSSTDVFMQVIVKDDEDRDDHRKMQLVFKDHHHDSFNGVEEPVKSHALIGRGKDSFFLVAQDLDNPALIRDSRKVLNQVSSKMKKPIKMPASSKLPTFPNYPVEMREVKPENPLSFHQAFGTDFEASSGLVTTKTTTTTSTTTTTASSVAKRPSLQVSPPDVDALVSQFYSSKKKKKPIHRLPKNHPLERVLPPSARVVGIQPLRKIPLSNRVKAPEFMTLGDFLRKFPNMDKMRSASIVPVPVTDEKHIRMIELLAAQPTAVVPHKVTGDLDEMFKELEQLISKRAERKISFTFGQDDSNHQIANFEHNHDNSNGETANQGLSVRPRGGHPGPRFMNTQKPDTTSSSSTTTPLLEFGFKPILATSPKPTTNTIEPSTVLGQPSRFRFSSYDDIIDETDTLVAPRLPRQPSDELDNEISDAFFFTTTPKPTTSSLLLASPANTANPDLAVIKPGVFDMRKFFFIPTKQVQHSINTNGLTPVQPNNNAERRVHHGPPRHQFFKHIQQRQQQKQKQQQHRFFRG